MTQEEKELLTFVVERFIDIAKVHEDVITEKELDKLYSIVDKLSGIA